MLPDRRTVAVAGSALAALAAMALSACAPVGASSGGYDQPVAENAAAASNQDKTAKDSDEESAKSKAKPAKKQAEPEDVTDELIGKAVPKMGRVVTDQDGFLLYRFDKDDPDAEESACVGDCERVWPPALTVDGKPKLKGVDKDLVGTITREDGTKQLTLGGQPLYRYIGDKQSGQWKGQKVAGTWFVAQPNGKKNLECLPKGTPKAVAPPPLDDEEPADKAAGKGAGAEKDAPADKDDAPAGSAYTY